MINSKSIREASDVIKNGGLVAFPTETVYGLGANALDPIAVAKIFAVKERPSFDPLIVHIADIADIKRLTKSEDPRVYALAQKFWPGPLTIVLPKSDIVPDIVTSGLPTVGIRMPNNNIALELIKLSGCPISAPSANKFGRISPTRAEHVKKQLPEVDCVLDGGPASVGIESTVITLDSMGFIILREGFITASDLLKVLPASLSTVAEHAPASPGLLKSHYSPLKPIYIEGRSNNLPDISRAGYLSFNGQFPNGFKKVDFLSKSSDLKDAAVNLFGALHRMEDDSDIDFIVSQPVPEEGIGRAIMDRLTKAAYQYSEKPDKHKKI
jgi:L-threonylcarbamoyladenylate synthase